MAKFSPGFNLVIVPNDISAEKLCENFKNSGKYEFKRTKDFF